jgi:transposase
MSNFDYCLLGATAEELAGFFDVTRGTINSWIANIREFATALLEAAVEGVRNAKGD